MQKEEKFCDACQEAFANKYSFCPICGAHLLEAEVLSTGAGFQITIVREKNVRQRNLLLLGTVMLLSMLTGTGLIYSIFNKTLDIGAIETDDPYSFISSIDPVSLDPDEDPRKADKKDGGGGGDQDKNPTQKGREATQVDNPLFSPSKEFTPVTDPAIKIRAATKGTKDNPLTNEPYGLPKGGLDPSDGEGCCTGQGPGRGTGQGPGDGPGLGPGKNGGRGGDEDGPDGGKPEDDDINTPKVKIGVTEPLKILSKPRANYTDQARENMIQGRVVLRVTFLASGSIGSITPISSLQFGLTEQAIAAARAIKFEPAKVNGRAVSVTKTIEYNFAIF